MKKRMNPKFTLEVIDREFLKLSRGWLSDASFRELILAQPVSEKDQEAWFAALPEKDDYLIWGVKEIDWIGACGLKNINFQSKSAEYWGYIYPEDRRRVGIGRKIFQLLSNRAREDGLEKLWLRVSEKNGVAINAYERWGFVSIESRERGVNYMEAPLWPR